ncbi:hypothetical protein BGZ73_001807, partial [Actinomortierella ambigua]
MQNPYANLSDMSEGEEAGDMSDIEVPHSTDTEDGDDNNNTQRQTTEELAVVHTPEGTEIAAPNQL